MNVGLQFLGNGRCCNDDQKFLLVHHGKKQSSEHYSFCDVHSKLFCLLCIKVYNLIDSNIRCLLLEKIAKNIYQVLQSHFKKAKY